MKNKVSGTDLFMNADEFQPDPEPPKKIEKIKEKYTKRTYQKKIKNFTLYKQYKSELFPNFSDLEKKIYFNYFEKNLNGLEVAEKLSVSKSSVSYYIQKLNKKLKTIKKKQKVDPTPRKEPKSKPKSKLKSKPKYSTGYARKSRLHAQQFVIQIKAPSVKYCKLVRRGIRQKIINGETIKFHKSKIEIYSYKSFWGEDPKTATEESVTYFNKLFSTLENDLNLILVKERGENIVQVNNHYALVGCEFAKQYYEMFGKHLRYLDESGKTRLHTDKSKNSWETESSNPQSAQDDIELVKHSYDEIFNAELMNRTQTTDAIGKLAQSISALQNQINQIHLMQTQQDTIINQQIEGLVVSTSNLTKSLSSQNFSKSIANLDPKNSNIYL